MKKTLTGNVFLLVFLIILVSSFFLSGCTSSGDAPRLDLVRPTSRNYTTDDDEIRIQLDCRNVDEMRLNGRRMSPRDMERICSRTSLYYDLEEGDNEFYFEGISTDDDDYDRAWLRLNVEYEK
ncbi:hypothetical protein JW710_03350 [Candidatus Dojkabacteria bacterium]|nr:hypothetical protein [Candidatus Dojkabacteria bacterium]